MSYELTDDVIEVQRGPEPGGMGGAYRTFGATLRGMRTTLARLAEKSQLLVVTHSPQVAARAAHHYRIEKAHEDGATRTTVRKLTPDERREEIARMLSGAAITDEARAQAARLLEAA